MAVAAPLLERLVLCKYLVTQARLALSSAAPFSAGLALGNAQDAIELFLRVLLEHFHASVKEQAAFNQLLDTLEAELPSPLTHRTALNQLNKARVNFKHFGLEPRREDAEKLLADVETFLPSACQQYLGLDYGTLSLASAIGHLRTENWLRLAEERLQGGDFLGSIDASAAALAVFQRKIGIRPARTQLDRYGRLHRSNDDLSELVRAAEAEFDSIRSELDLILSGMNLAHYRVFRRLSPSVVFSMAGTVRIGRYHGDTVTPTREHAALCLSFVVDTALALKRTHLPGRFAARPPKLTGRVEVIASGDIVVYPGDQEILRPANVGEVLPAAEGSRSDGYVAVLLDDEVAFISQACVRAVD